MALIGPTGRPLVKMRIKQKREKNKCFYKRQFHACALRKHAAFEPTASLTFCMWGGVADIINCAKFLEIRQKVSELTDRKMAFPIDFVHRP